MISIDEHLATNNRYPAAWSYNFTNATFVWEKILEYGLDDNYITTHAYDGSSTIYAMIPYFDRTYSSFFDIDVNSGPATNHR